MERFTKSLLTLSAAALLGTGATLALADPMGMPGMGGTECGPMRQGDHAQRFSEHMAQRHAQRQAALKTALKLTPAQEGAWKQFTESTQPAVKTPPRFDRTEWNKLTTPQRLEKMQALKQEHDAQMAKHAEAIKQFYAELSPEQQKTFDQQMLKGWGPAERGMHR